VLIKDGYSKLSSNLKFLNTVMSEDFSRVPTILHSLGDPSLILNIMLLYDIYVSC
jgi:uncharacterized protein YcgL (UPF0745 family)